MPWTPAQHRPQFAPYPQRTPPPAANLQYADFAPYPQHTPQPAANHHHPEYAPYPQRVPQPTVRRRSDSPVARRRNRGQQLAAAPPSPSVFEQMQPYVLPQQQQLHA